MSRQPQQRITRRRRVVGVSWEYLRFFLCSRLREQKRLVPAIARSAAQLQQNRFCGCINRPKNSKSRALERILVPFVRIAGSADARNQHGCNERVFCDHCSMAAASLQRRMAAAVASVPPAAKRSASGKHSPRTPHAFADGDRVLSDEVAPGRRQPAHSPQPTSWARQPRTAGAPSFTRTAAPTRPGRSMVPIRSGGPLTLFTATTRAYRLAASTQDVGASVLEVGCDLGATTRRLVARGCAVGRVDKAADRLRTARDAVPGATFLVCDVLCEPDRVQGSFSSVFVDISDS